MDLFTPYSNLRTLKYDSTYLAMQPLPCTFRQSFKSKSFRPLIIINDLILIGVLVFDAFEVFIVFLMTKHLLKLYNFRSGNPKLEMRMNNNRI
jgi:hypothetical protein